MAMREISDNATFTFQLIDDARAQVAAGGCRLMLASAGLKPPRPA